MTLAIIRPQRQHIAPGSREATRSLSPRRRRTSLYTLVLMVVLFLVFPSTSTVPANGILNPAATTNSNAPSTLRIVTPPSPLATTAPQQQVTPTINLQWKFSHRSLPAVGKSPYMRRTLRATTAMEPRMLGHPNLTWRLRRRRRRTIISSS